jgi:hypothetical protein
MSYSLNKGYTDTISTAKSIDIPDMDYSVDFSIISDKPGEVILTNITSPMDRGETIRFALTQVKDVYTGTDIDASYKAPSHAGVSLVAQVSDTWRYYDSTDLSLPAVDLPISAHVVIKVPKTSYITADDFLTIAKRAFSLLFDTGAITSARLVEMLKGSLDPIN